MGTGSPGRSPGPPFDPGPRRGGPGPTTVVKSEQALRERAMELAVSATSQLTSVSPLIEYAEAIYAFLCRTTAGDHGSA